MGCGFTAQLGAMRVNEEIDALEAIAVPSVPYLVTTRLLAGGLAVIPLYVLGLLASYTLDPAHHDHALRPVIRHVQPLLQSVPAADRHHHLVPKVIVFAMIIILTHCYYGYKASGGPAGVAWRSGVPSGWPSPPSSWSTCFSTSPSTATR